MSGFFSTAENCDLRDTVIYRSDPRLKLLLLLLCIVTIFSAHGFNTLFGVGLLVIGVLVYSPNILQVFLRRCYQLRWLLLFSLLLHLFLTPGRTLFGVRFLSYDGLLRGLMVDLQLSLALFFTLLFALITAPEAVAWGAARLLKPLQWLGFPIAEAGGSLILVLHFLPQVFALGEPLVSQARQQAGKGVAERLQLLSSSIGDAILYLVDKADQLAHEIAGGKNPLVEEHPLTYHWRWIESLTLVAAGLFFRLCWSL